MVVTNFMRSPVLLVFNRKKNKSLSRRKMLRCILPTVMMLSSKSSQMEPNQRIIKVKLTLCQSMSALCKKAIASMLRLTSNSNLFQTNTIQFQGKTIRLPPLQLSSNLQESAREHKMPRKWGVTKQATQTSRPSQR